MTWGEATWTAGDLLAREYIVTDPDGTIYGRRDNEHDAIGLREALGSEGVECWVVPVSDLEIEGDDDEIIVVGVDHDGPVEVLRSDLSTEEASFLSNVDPGDETEWDPAEWHGEVCIQRGYCACDERETC